MPLSLRRRHDRRAPRLPAGGGRVRRLAPRHGAGRGADALDRLQWALTNDLTKIAPGPGPVHAPARRGGRIGARRHHRVVDRRRGVRRHAQRLEHRPGASPRSAGSRDDARAAPCSRCRARGARDSSADVFPDAAARSAGSASGASTSDGVACMVAGTGYTGEDGVEIAVPADRAGDLWEAITRRGVVPAGLGARDTLRLEAALPLHGHELGPGITPLQAGLGWVVAWRKDEFRGRHALEVEQASGPTPPAAWHRDRGSPPTASRIGGAGRRRARSARSPAATSHRCSTTASPSPSCRPTSRRAPRCRSTSAASRAAPAPWSSTPFVAKH